MNWAWLVPQDAYQVALWSLFALAAVLCTWAAATGRPHERSRHGRNQGPDPATEAAALLAELHEDPEEDE